MAFVKFTKIGSRIGTPKVSIWTRGQIGFNQGAVMEYKFDSYTYAVLYYDVEDKKIGFELTNDENAEGAIKLVVRKNAGISMSALPFLRISKIDFSKTRQYGLSYDKEHKLYVIDLNNPITKKKDVKQPG
jgi:hypothetical protein